MKKICTAILFLFMGLFIFPNAASAATTIEEGKVTVVSNVDEIASKAVLTYETTMHLEKKETKSSYFKFTITKDSYVVIDSSFEEANVGSFPILSFVLYANEAMTKKAGTLNSSGASNTSEMILQKGTYYVAINEKAQSFPCDSTFRFSVSAVPLTKLLSASVKVNATKTAATITVSEGLASTLRTIQYRSGAVASNQSNKSTYWNTMTLKNLESKNKDAIKLKAGVKKFTVKKNGTYTIRIDNNYDNNYVSYSIQVKVTGIDTKAPTVTGVANKKTYKKAVTIKFKDTGSGIKTAKLNGTTIRSGKKISKKGSYKLVVTDKAGNKKTITFKIK